MSLPKPDGEPETPELDPKDEEKEPAKAPSRSRRVPALETALADSFRVIGGVTKFANAEDGEIIISNAAPLAAALVRLSKTNPAVKRWLENMVTGSSYGELLQVVIVGIAFPTTNEKGPTLPIRFAWSSTASIFATKDLWSVVRSWRRNTGTHSDL